MKILFIGLGSIAARHIRNLREVTGGELVIDVVRSGMGRPISNGLKGLINRVATEKDKLDCNYDAVFITNPTSLHYETLLKYGEKSDAFFIEKPVFVTGEENESTFFTTGKKYYVACPLRYTNVIQWLRNNLDFRTVYAMRVISSSYLPDWRPDTDYRLSYSARKAMGGGVSVDLVHEWDYISYLIGFPRSVFSLIKKKSELEIDSDDIAVYIAEYEDKLVELHLDYFGRKTMRRIELFTKKDTIVADMLEQRIKWLGSGKVLLLSEDRDSYQKKELQHFLDIMSGKADSDNTIAGACRILRIARGRE